MGEWWNSLTSIQQIFAGVAIPATVILVVQSILLLFGIGDGISDHDFDVHDMSSNDMDISESGDGGLALFSIRGIVAFFTVGGWSGVVMINLGLHPILSGIIAFILGALALIGIAFMMKSAMKLQYNGTMNLNECIGKSGKVYIRVPKKGIGTGKVTVTVQGKLCELDALTDENCDLTTGMFVSIIGVTDDGILKVTKQK